MSTEERLPARLKTMMTSKLRAAYPQSPALAAEAALETLARELELAHPGVAGSIREGLAETFRVTRLGIGGRGVVRHAAAVGGGGLPLDDSEQVPSDRRRRRRHFLHEH